MAFKQQTDEALWQALKQSDARAFEELFNRYWQKLFTTSYSYLKDKTQCLEIVHDIFLNIWLKRDRLEIISFEAYVTASARYHVYKQLKAGAATKLQYCTNPEFFVQRTNGNIGEENMRYRELEDMVDEHLSKLPKRCVEIYNLSRKELLSNDEIAMHFGISKRTVENQLTHALHHLRLLPGIVVSILMLVFTLLIVI